MRGITHLGEWSKVAPKPERVGEKHNPLEKRCEICGEIIETVDSRGYELYADCACIRRQRQRNKLKKFQALSIKDRQQGDNTFGNASYDSREEEELYTHAKGYCKKFKERIDGNDGLLFFGDPGNGKTYLANCIANELDQQGYSVLSFPLAGYLRSLRDGYGGKGAGGQEETKFLQMAEEVDLLYIDDLGSEQLKDGWAKEKVFSLIDTRYRAGKPLLITTNLSPKELNEFLIFNKTNKIMDRLKEVVEFIPFTWPSKRSKKRKRFLEYL